MLREDIEQAPLPPREYQYYMYVHSGSEPRCEPLILPQSYSLPLSSRYQRDGNQDATTN